jgi:hypothetical protein
VKETTLKEGVEVNPIISDAFSTKYLPEEKEETGDEMLSLRINERNREALDVIKWLLHEPKDATAIKYALEWTKNDLQRHLSESTWRKICSDTRRKPTIKQPRIFQNE